MKRQVPKAHDLAPLLKFKKPVLSPRERRLAKALTIEDLRRIAKRRTPKAAFDYTDGAADREVSLAARVAAATASPTPARSEPVLLAWSRGNRSPAHRAVRGACVDI